MLGKVVFDDAFLLISSDIPLINAHFVPQHISRFYQPVSQIAVSRFYSHLPMERSIALPQAFYFPIDQNFYLFACRRVKQFFPVLFVKEEVAFAVCTGHHIFLSTLQHGQCFDTRLIVCQLKT